MTNRPTQGISGFFVLEPPLSAEQLRALRELYLTTSEEAGTVTRCRWWPGDGGETMSWRQDKPEGELRGAMAWLGHIIQTRMNPWGVEVQGSIDWSKARPKERGRLRVRNGKVESITLEEGSPGVEQLIAMTAADWASAFDDDPTRFEELIDKLIVEGGRLADPSAREAVAFALLTGFEAVEDEDVQEWILDRAYWCLHKPWGGFPEAPLARLRARFLPDPPDAPAEIVLKVAPVQLTLEYDPEDAETRVFLAGILLMGTLTSQALANVDKALAINPDSADGGVLRARCLLALDRREDAIAQLESTAARCTDLSGELLAESAFDALRDDPRFKTLSASIAS